MKYDTGSMIDYFNNSTFAFSVDIYVGAVFCLLFPLLHHHTSLLLPF